MADEVDLLKDWLAQEKTAAQDAEAELTRLSEVAAQANVDRLIEGLDAAKQSAREAVQEASRLTDTRIPNISKQTTATGAINQIGDALQSIVTLDFESAFIDPDKQAASNAANEIADTALAAAKKLDQELALARQTLDAAAKASSDLLGAGQREPLTDTLGAAAQKEQQSLFAQAEAEAKRRTTADAKTEQLLTDGNRLLGEVNDAMRNLDQPQPLDL